MSSRCGFIASNAPMGITTAYGAARTIALDGTGVLDAGAEILPGAAFLSHIEINGVLTGAKSATTLTFWLSWDAAGDYPMSAASAATTLVVALTTSDLVGIAVGLDVWVQTIDRQSSPGTVYLNALCSAGTLTINEARLFWRKER